MNWTHQKRAYKARLLQWDGTNLSAVSVELRELGYDSFELERGTIMARGKGMSLLCIHQGNWLRFGQNGSFKVMRPDEQATYVPIQNIGWVSSEERLPQYGQRVIVASKHNIVQHELFYLDDPEEIGLIWQHDSFDGFDITGTHWMPLPDAPKGGE